MLFSGWSSLSSFSCSSVATWHRPALSAPSLFLAKVTACGQSISGAIRGFFITTADSRFATRPQRRTSLRARRRRGYPTRQSAQSHIPKVVPVIRMTLSLRDRNSASRSLPSQRTSLAMWGSLPWSSWLSQRDCIAHREWVQSPRGNALHLTADRRRNIRPPRRRPLGTISSPGSPCRWLRPPLSTASAARPCRASCRLH